MIKDNKIEEPIVIIDMDDTEIKVKYSDLLYVQERKIKVMYNSDSDYITYTLTYRDKYHNEISVDICKELYDLILDLRKNEPAVYVSKH